MKEQFDELIEELYREHQHALDENRSADLEAISKAIILVAKARKIVC